MATLFFIYQDAEKTLLARAVTNVVDKGSYFQGFCLSSKGVRSFRHDRVVEFVTDENDLSARLLHWDANRSSIPYKSHQLEVHFTGFKDADKTRLSQSAKDAGMLVRSTMSGYIDILCCGRGASVNKVEQAREKQLIVLSESQLMDLLETGEMPSC